MSTISLFETAKKPLRDYQKRCVSEICSSDENLLVSLPTGAGKTVIAGNVMEQLHDKTVFIVPRIELIQQAVNEFDGDVDVIWANKTDIQGRSITVASKQSMFSQANAVPQDATFIFDEAHIGIKQTHDLVEHFKPRRVIGLTATPERMDGVALLKYKGTDKPLEYQRLGVFDRLMQAETIPGLIDAGYLSPLRYFNKHIPGVAEQRGEKTDEFSEQQVRQLFGDCAIWGDVIDEYRKNRIGSDGLKRPALGFATTINLAKDVAACFNKEGFDFRVIHGGMSPRERQELIKMLETREIDGLVNAALLTYGFDCPPVSYAFLCRHICSRPLWFQIVGRILRLCKGKEDAIFVDHTDTISRFSSVDNPMPILNPIIHWQAEGMSQEMKQEERKEKKYQHKRQEQVLKSLPAKMIEVTPSYITGNLILALSNKDDKLQEQKERNSQLEEERDKAVKTANHNYKVGMELKSRLATAKAEIEKLKKEAKADEIICMDNKETFNFSKSNYARVRARMDNHESTVRELESILHDDHKRPDAFTWHNSMAWWEKNYRGK